MDLIKRNLFWCGIVLVLVSLLGVGGWEILSELSGAQEKAGSFKTRKDQLSGKAKNPAEIPSSKEWEEWKAKRAAFEADFEAIRAHVRNQIERYEDLYFDGLHESYEDAAWSRSAGVPYPPEDIKLHRSKEHWISKEIPSQAFKLELYAPAFKQARERLISEGAEFGLSQAALTLVAGQEEQTLKQGGAAVVGAQKAYWGAFGIVKSFASAKPEVQAVCQRLFEEEMKLLEQEAKRDATGRPKKEEEIRRLQQRRQQVGGLEIRFVHAQAGSVGGGAPVAGGAAARKVEVREADFYRAVPVDVNFECDVAVMPTLVERVLTHPHFTFRLRDDFEVMYEDRDASRTRVRVQMQLEMWDWEIKDVASYLGASGS